MLSFQVTFHHVCGHHHIIKYIILDYIMFF